MTRNRNTIEIIVQASIDAAFDAMDKQPPNGMDVAIAANVASLTMNQEHLRLMCDIRDLLTDVREALLRVKEPT